MKYKHSITIAYNPKNIGRTSGSLVMHFNIIDKNPNIYQLADLINMYLCNSIEGQEIWGTYYEKNAFIYPIFYCKKPTGEVMLQMEVQSATIAEPWCPLNEWNINDSIYKFVTNTIALND